MHNTGKKSLNVAYVYQLKQTLLKTHLQLKKFLKNTSTK